MHASNLGKNQQSTILQSKPEENVHMSSQIPIPITEKDACWSNYLKRWQ